MEGDADRSAARPVIVHWPRDATARLEAGRHGIPCLLVIESQAKIPTVGRGEDWVRSGVDERDLAHRLRRLAELGREPAPALGPLLAPAMSDEAHRLAAVLTATPGGLVSTKAIADAVCPSETPVGPERRAVIDAALRELRSRLNDSGWAVDAVPGTGYVLSPLELAQ